MAVSLNSVIGFNSSLPTKNWHDTKSLAISTAAFPNSVAMFGSSSKLQLSWRNSASIPSVADSDQLATDTNDTEQLKEASSAVSSDQNRTPTKRSPLTARERLKAARVLSRNAGSKPSKQALGKNVIDALRESDKGRKRSRLPEAPTNMLDDSKRGLSKPGWTFDFPGGSDLLVIAFSFVFISTVMFATTFVVWKVGAIHFNEY
ncbi:hypothetical protein LINPERPRIM_LOCUS33601 [Linum perenne]